MDPINHWVDNPILCEGHNFWKFRINIENFKILELKIKKRIKKPIAR